MARFDVHRVKGLASPVIDIQAEALRDLRTRIVIPLARLDQQSLEGADRLRPKIVIEGVVYLLNTPEMAAIPCSSLDERVTNLEDQHHVIVDAVDFLMQGF